MDSEHQNSTAFNTSARYVVFNAGTFYLEIGGTASILCLLCGFKHLSESYRSYDMCESFVAEDTFSRAPYG